jgi:hypothetical protein
MTPEQLGAAVDVGDAFWTALADDDDEAARRLMAAAPLAILARGPITPGTPYMSSVGDAFAPPGPGIAGRIRDHLRIDRRDCGRIGTVSRAERLNDRELRIAYAIADKPTYIAAGKPYTGWRFELVLDEGRWLVDPMRAHDREAVEIVDLGIGPRLS